MAQVPDRWIAALKGDSIEVSQLIDVLPTTTDEESDRRCDVRPLFPTYTRENAEKTDQDATRAAGEREIEEAVARATTRLEAERCELQTRFAATIEKLDVAIRGYEKVAASDVVDLALLVAEEIVNTEVHQNPTLLRDAVESALAAFPHDGIASVSVHPSDFNSIKEKIDITSSTIEWNYDSSLLPGDCIVETPTQVIDVSVHTRLAAVRESLSRVLVIEEQDQKEAE